MDPAGKAVKSVNPLKLAESPAKGRGKPKLDEEKLKKACKDFEAIFINKMIKNMRATVPKSSLLDGGTQQEIYQSLFDEELSKSLAGKGGMGLGKILQRHLSPRVPQPKGDTAAPDRETMNLPVRNPEKE